MLWCYAYRGHWEQLLSSVSFMASMMSFRDEAASESQYSDSELLIAWFDYN